MSNLVPVVNAGSFPSLPSELMKNMAAQFASSFNGLSGDIRRIKVCRMDFALVDGGAEVHVPNGALEVVILAAAPENHAVWYERPYAPGQEPEAPDLVWNRPNENVYPEALPVQFRTKVKTDGREGWAYQIRRRIAVAVIRTQPDGSQMIDLDNPYVMDLPSMSLYGKGNPTAGYFKFSGLGSLCKQMSAHGMVVTPAMFPVRIVIDPNVPVSGVVAFQPVMSGGMPAFFDAATIGRIYETVVADSTMDLLTIREKLTYTPKVGTAQVPPMQAATIAAPVAQPQPVVPAAPVAQPQPVVPAAPVAQSQPVVPAASAAQPQPIAPAAPTTEAAMLAQAAAVLNAGQAAPVTPVANVQNTAPETPFVSSDAVKKNVSELLGRFSNS